MAARVPDSVADALRTRLRDNPADTDAFQQLKAHYRARGEFGSLFNLLKGWAGFTRDAVQRAGALREAAALAYSELGDTARAIEMYRRALHYDPLDVDASEALQSLWEDAGQYTELTEYLQTQLEALTDYGAPKAELAVIRYRLGELWGKQFERPDEALHQYTKAFELDPTLLRAAYEARQLCLQAGRLREAAALFEQEAAAEQDAARRGALLAELAELYGHDLGDLDGAISAMERACRQLPDDAELLHALVTWLSQRADSLAPEAAQPDRGRLADALVTLAALVPAEEGIAFLEAAREQVPSHTDAMLGLEARLDGTAREIELAGHWVDFVANAPDGTVANTRRVRLADAYARQGQLEDALFCLQPAVSAGVPDAVLLSQRLQGTGRSVRDTATHSDVTDGSDESGQFRALREAEASRARMRPARSQGPGSAPDHDSAGDERDRQDDQVGQDSADRDAADRGQHTVMANRDDLEDLRHRAGDPESGVHEDVTVISAAPLEAFLPPIVKAKAPGAAEPEPPRPRRTREIGADALAAARAASQPPPPQAAHATGGTETAHAPSPPALPAIAPVTTDPPPTQAVGEGDGASPPVAAGAAPGPASAPPTEHADHSNSTDDLEQLRRQVGECVRHRQHDEAAALNQRILALAPSDRDAFNYLDSHYRRSRDHQQRLNLLLDTGGHPELPEKTRVLRLREAASLAETRLRDVNTAVKVWRQIMRMEPDQDEPKRNLKRLLERAKRWGDLLDSLAQEAQAAEGKGRADLLRRMIGIHRDQRNDERSALPLMADLAELDPEDQANRDALCDALMADGRHAEALPLLAARVDQSSSRSQRLQLLRKLAALCDELDDPVGAFDAYTRIVELVPKDLPALERMEALDEQAGNFERLVETLAAHAKLLTPTEACALHRRMADIAETELIDRERAVVYLTAALDRAPGDAEVVDALCAVFERAERYAELVALLRERAEQTRKGPQRLALLRRVAQLLADPMDQVAEAAEVWRAVTRQHEDPEGLRFLADYARGQGDAAELADVLGRLVALPDTQHEAVEWLLERAELQRSALDNPRAAIGDLDRILRELDPGCDPALEALQSAAHAAGRFTELAAALDARLQRAEEAATRQHYAERAADLAEGPLRDPARAEAALQAWVEADPDDPVPHRRLRPLLAKAGRHGPLLATLDALALLEGAEEARIGATLEAAALLAGPLGDAEGGWERLQPLVGLQRADVDAALLALAQGAGRMPKLFGAYEAAGRFDDLLQLLQMRLQAADDDDTRVDLLRRIAILNIEQLEDPSAAEAAYDSLLELTEDTDALQFIRSAALQRDDPERLAGALRRLAALEEDSEEQRHLRLEHARLLHARLGRAAEAVELLKGMLAQFGQASEGLADELIAACEGAGDFASMAQQLEQQLGVAEGVDARIPVARRLADLYDNELGDPRRAIAALRTWADADPEDPDPLRRLRHRLEEGEPGPELLQVLDALSDKEHDRDAQLGARVAAAELCAGPLGEAETGWERLVALVPEDFPRADQALAKLARRLERTEVYYGLLEVHERYGDLAALLAADIEAERDAERRTGLHRRLGRVYSQPLGDLHSAAQHFEAILAVIEDGEALRFMHAQALHADDPEALADTLGRLAAIEDDPDERRDLCFEHAHVLGRRLGRRADAIAVLAELLGTIAPDFDAAIDELISLAEAEGDDANLAEGLDRMLAREHEPEERAGLAMRLYALRSGPLADTDGARAALEAWAEARPADPTPHRHLRPLLRAGDDDEALLRSLDALSERSPDLGERQGARIEAAALCRTRRADPEGAWQRLAPSVAEEHAEGEAELQSLALEGQWMDALCTLYEQAQRFDDLVRLLGERAEGTDDHAQRAELYARCARVLAGPLGDEVAAAEAWQAVLEFREDAEALGHLRAFHQRMDDVEQLADVLGRLSNQLTEPAQQRELLFERALLLSDRLERPAEAISVLRYIVSELDPRFAAAIEELIVVCEGEGDYAGLADGLSRQLELPEHVGSRPETARRLAELYARELDDPEQLRAALARWAEVEPDNPEPHRRRRPLLDAKTDGVALQATLDALSTVDPDAAARREAARASAALTFEELKDAAGAWKRLAPLVHAGDAEAEPLALRLARESGYGAQLASIYVMRAQRAREGADAGKHWGQAMRVYDEVLKEPAEALEAALRMFATDMHDAEHLAEVERLAVEAKAWPRLGQVYGRLQKMAEGPEAQRALLVRQAKLLQDRAGNIPGALKCVLEACKLATADDDIYAWAEELAGKADGHAELQWLYERRAKSAKGAEERGQYLLRAARTADVHLKDREQAMVHLREALATTEDAPQIDPALEDLARELDRGRPELGQDDVRRGLIHAHLELATKRGQPFGPVLVLRASQLLRDELKDDGGCYDVLRKGATSFPGDADILDALHEAALRIHRLDGLDAQLARMAKDVSAPETRLDLLLRRGDLLALELKRHDSAARVYREILNLDPEYEGVAEALCQCLSQAGRYRELLDALGKQLELADARDARLGLMRRMAQVWENDLKNRPAALGVWRELLDYASDDAEAAAAVKRLQA